MDQRERREFGWTLLDEIDERFVTEVVPAVEERGLVFDVDETGVDEDECLYEIVFLDADQDVRETHRFRFRYDYEDARCDTESAIRERVMDQVDEAIDVVTDEIQTQW